ncbi:MAG: hypothetical protein ACYC5A_11115 [Thermoleophilia bacterium]
MDLSKLSMSDKLIGVGAIISVISTFLPWYGWSTSDFLGVSGASMSASLWDTSGGMAFIIMAAGLVAIAVIVLRMMDIFDLSDQGVPEGIAMLAVSGLAALFTLIRLLSIPGGAGIMGVGRSWGLWVGLIGAAIFVAGGVMKFQEDR